MGDPRNVAHAKKVVQEKRHKHKESATQTAHVQRQPVAKAEPNGQTETVSSAPSVSPSDATKAEQKPDQARLEKSLTVLAKLKEMEFHSRANIEKLAELSLTIEEELKQKAFVEAIGAVYSAEETLHSKLSELIEKYQMECDRSKAAG